MEETATKQMNRIDTLFREKGNNILSVYFTAGYPELNDTVSIMQYLQEAGADMIEVGIPFSDPIADGPTIQDSSTKAIQQGMSVKKLFEQLNGIREKIQIPVLLMGYLNPIVQYGFKEFCQHCEDNGIDGLIIPDLPLAEYQEIYKPILDQHGLYNIFLITPQTSDARVAAIDESSHGFIYMVSSASVTGAKKGISDIQMSYFKRIQEMKLKNPTLIGFGISDYESFSSACTHSQGAIIGSAFIQLLGQSKNLKQDITQFIQGIKNKEN